MNDLRFSFRQLFKHQGSSLLAILILALGIGGTTAVFSVADKVLLNPIPGRDRERLLVLGMVDLIRDVHMGLSPAAFAELALHTNTFESIAAFESFRLDEQLRLSDVDVKVTGARVTPGFFELFGGRPIQGRAFLKDDGVPGNERTMIASYGLWRQQFGGRQDFVGSFVELSGNTHRVVGIMPPSFQFPFGTRDSQFWLPHSIPPDEAAASEPRRGHFWTGIGLLKSGISSYGTAAFLNTLSQRWRNDYPENDRQWAIESKPVRSLFVSESIERTLWSIQAAVAMLLLITCANVSVLLLARVMARRGEFSIRMAIGARWSQIGRLVVLENLVLAGIAGAFGLACAWGAIHGLQNLFLDDLPIIRDLGLDWNTFGLAVAAALVVAIFFGTAPVWYVFQLQPQDSLKDGSQHHSGGTRHTGFQDGLVVVQVCLALVLLAGSGLMIQSTLRLLHFDPGLKTDGLYALGPGADFWNAWSKELSIGRRQASDASSAGRRETSERLIREEVAIKLLWQETFLEKLAAAPEIQSAAVGASGEGILGVSVDGGETQFVVRHKNVGVRGGNYFETLQARLLSGRFLDDSDSTPGSDSIVISREMADRCWPGKSPLGGRVSVREENFVADFRVVGVIENIRDWKRDIDPEPTFFVPIERMAEVFNWEPMTGYFVRTGLETEAFRQLALRLGFEMSPVMDSPRLSSIASMHAQSTAPRRILMWLLISMAALGLLLAALGIYAVLAYAVVRRTREVGIRMAIGAQKAEVRNLFLRRGLRLILNGTVLGLVAACTGARYLESLLFQVDAGDPWSFIGAFAVLISVTLLACWLPARRAANTDPMKALRFE